MNLERYQVPAAVWDGEWIELPDSDGARFLVKLPAASNRVWQREALQLMVDTGIRLDEGGKVDVQGVSPPAIVNYRHKRLEAFARLCVIQGPDGFDLSKLTGQFWPALEALYEIAMERAELQAKEAESAVGESSALPVGRSNGQGESSSTHIS